MVSLTPHDIETLVARLDRSLRATQDAGFSDPSAAICVELVIGDPGDAANAAVDGSDSDSDPGEPRPVSSWHLCLDEHGGRAAVGPAVDPTVVVFCDAETLAMLRSGALNVQRAIDGGRLKVRGDLGALARARPVLQMLTTRLAEPPATS